MFEGAIETERQVILSLVKLGFLVFLFLYVIFSAIVIKQARVMSETLQVGFEKQIKLLVLVHFATAVIIFILAILIL
jgi:hypothetical protein